MKVFKFGGASVKDAEGVKNIAKVLKHEQVEKGGGKLSIETGLKKEVGGKSNWGDSECWGCESSECQCFEFDYEIYAPANALLEIESISGDIEITEWNSGIQAKTISGFIDIGLDPRSSKDIKLKSVTGEVYTDLDLRLDEGSTSFSKKMNTVMNGGGKLVKLSTVSGDIFLRKAQ